MGGGKGQEFKEGEGERVEIIEVFADVYRYSASTLIVLRGYNAQHTSAIVIFSYSMRRLAMQMCALLTRSHCCLK